MLCNYRKLHVSSHVQLPNCAIFPPPHWLTSSQYISEQKFLWNEFSGVILSSNLPLTWKLGSKVGYSSGQLKQEVNGAGGNYFFFNLSPE